jgi:hypothetical protein
MVNGSIAFVPGKPLGVMLVDMESTDGLAAW